MGSSSSMRVSTVNFKVLGGMDSGTRDGVIFTVSISVGKGVTRLKGPDNPKVPNWTSKHGRGSSTRPLTVGRTFRTVSSSHEGRCHDKTTVPWKVGP